MSFLGIAAAAVLSLRSLFAVVMMSSIYSLLAAGLFVLMDAVDVAFTEAAVGAGVATVLLLTTLALTGTEERRRRGVPLVPLLVVVATGALLFYATLDMPSYGDPGTPVQTHLTPQFLERSIPDTTVPNVVTTILASYRGFDTLGEVVVIFTAGIGVIILLGGRFRREEEPEPDGGRQPDGADAATFDGEPAEPAPRGKDAGP